MALFCCKLWRLTSRNTVSWHKAIKPEFSSIFTLAGVIWNIVFRDIELQFCGMTRLNEWKYMQYPWYLAMCRHGLRFLALAENIWQIFHLLPLKKPQQLNFLTWKILKKLFSNCFELLKNLVWFAAFKKAEILSFSQPRLNLSDAVSSAPLPNL